ncbi:MAG: hypothetical protein KF780_02725 [Sphingomonas sp.]|nr:hypothetical protein [Sphingomonas sp.]
MGVSIIDGAIEAADLKRATGRVRIYRSITIRRGDGQTEEVKKPIVHADLTPHVEPGKSGRFYLFQSIDHRGIHAVRPHGGAPVFRYPRTNELAGMGLTLFTAVWIAISLNYIGDFSIFALLGFLIGATVWVLNWRLRRSAERQYADDNGGMI